MYAIRSYYEYDLEDTWLADTDTGGNFIAHDVSVVRIAPTSYNFV